MFEPTEKSLRLLEEISNTAETWHHHHHILLDIAEQMYPEDYEVRYAEIGCYAGASSCLMLQRPKTKVIAVDLGMIDVDVVKGNIYKYNIHDNCFRYIQGHSQKKETIQEVQKELGMIDILFIDGCHDAEEVIKDFNAYDALIEKGGFVVFDDYSDPQYGVHLAVDWLVNNKFECYQIIGIKDNILKAKGDFGDNFGNCFIVRKVK